MQLREGRRPKVRLAQPESRIRFGVVGSKKSKILWGGCLAGALSPEIDLKSNIQVSICWRAAYFHKLDFRIIVPTRAPAADDATKARGRTGNEAMMNHHRQGSAN
jgi:hypothetical protein